jgi:Mg-chelatase subunit ChlD
MSSDDKALTIVKGSLLDLVKSGGTSLAIAFMDVVVVVVVDVSGSMETRDSRDGQSRYTVACQELAKLQEEHRGKFLVIAFSDDTKIAAGGVPEMMGAGTNMLHALKTAKEYDVKGMTFFVISDGQPDAGTEEDIIELAHTYKNTIQAIFVGPEEDKSAQLFLQRLAAESGGKFATADRVKELAGTVETLLLNSGQ